MAITTDDLSFDTKKEGDIVDLNPGLEEIVSRSGINTGLIHIFGPGATAVITAMEYEPGLIQDFPEMMDRLIPRNNDYKHHIYHNDGNGHSHLRASMIGPEMTLPIRDGRMVHGTWQHVVFMEMDNRPRSRKLLITIYGE